MPSVANPLLGVVLTWAHPGSEAWTECPLQMAPSTEISGSVLRHKGGSLP